MKRYITIFFLLVICSVAVFAQFGKISGKVTEQETKEPLVGANVVVEGTVFGTATDLEGNFTVLNISAGTYNIKVSYIGYQTTTVSGVKVLAGLTREVNVALSNTAVQVGSVTIVAERPLIEKSATSALRIQGSDDIQKLPVRGVQGYFALQPGVVTQNGVTYVRGSRNDEVGYAIEGADVRDVVGTSVRTNIGTAVAGDLVTTIPDALEEVSVQAGGYGAEYGGANAGIISQTYKTGGSNLKVTAQGETDNFGNYPGKRFLNTYSYGYSDYVFTVGAPLVGDKVKLFVAGENYFIRDRENSQWFWTGADLGYLPDISTGSRGDSALVKWPDGNVPGRSNNRYSGVSTLLFDFKPLSIRLSGSYTWSRNSNNNLIRDIFDLARNPMSDNSNLLLSGKASYFFSQKTFAEINIDYVDQRSKTYDPIYGDNLIEYSDSVSAAQHGYTFASLTGPQNSYVFGGFTFIYPGTNLTAYNKTDNTSIGGSVSITTQTGSHEIKIGASMTYWTISNYTLDPTTLYADEVSSPDIARNPVALAQALRALEQVNNYGFDEFGAPLSSGPDGPKHPYFGGAYFQDKIELSDIIINAGLRFDALYLDGWTLNPKDTILDKTNYIVQNLGSGKIFSYLEPRLGFSFPASDRTVFHVGFGKYVQAPPLYSLYRSRASALYIFEGGHYFPNPIGFNVEPERSTQYEVGFSQQVGDAAAIDLTGFFKETDGQLQVSYYPADPTSTFTNDYYAYSNGDFTSALGLELSLQIRRTNRFQAQLNYTLQDVRGTNSFANSTAAALNTGGPVPTIVLPLDYAETHRGSVSVDYRWDKGDGGPILQQLGVNLLFTFNSGHPYTLATGSGGQQGVDLGNILNDGDARTRFPAGPINAWTTPWVYQLDLRVDKTFSLGFGNLNVYVYVQNLLNTQNVINVYYRTGNAYDDGWLSNPAQSGTTVSTYGSAYSQLYQVVNLDNGQNQFRTNGFVNFGSPRQIRVGAKLEL